MRSDRRNGKRWLLEHADARPTHVVLDVATGKGFTGLAFTPLVVQVIGLDVCSGMLAHARLRAANQSIANITFQEGSASALPFPDAAFDIVTCGK